MMQERESVQEKREEIQRILGAFEDGDFTVIRWTKPEDVPEEGSYLLIKENDPEEGVVCSQGAYEKGRYWYADPGVDTEISRSRIVGWSYLPYDIRLDTLGTRRHS